MDKGLASRRTPLSGLDLTPFGGKPLGVVGDLGDHRDRLLLGPLTAGPDGVSFYRVAYTEEMIKRQPAAPALSTANG